MPDFESINDLFAEAWGIVEDHEVILKEKVSDVVREFASERGLDGNEAETLIRMTLQWVAENVCVDIDAARIAVWLEDAVNQIIQARS